MKVSPTWQPRAISSADDDLMAMGSSLHAREPHMIHVSL